eukprot:1193396-Prorocentrum_minimum.AAC.1
MFNRNYKGSRGGLEGVSRYAAPAKNWGRIELSSASNWRRTRAIWVTRFIGGILWGDSYGGGAPRRGRASYQTLCKLPLAQTTVSLSFHRSSQRAKHACTSKLVKS